MNYELIIVELIKHFIDSEGTDYLGLKGEDAPIALPDNELAKLTELRDIARKAIGWEGY